MKIRGIIMFAFVVLFVQVFVLNNLSVTPIIAPMVYIVLLVMMPLDSSQWTMLGVAAASGLVMDITMGTPGLNTLVTLPVAFFRRQILYTLAGFSPMSKEEGVPLPKRHGMRFHRYAIIMIVIHSVLFYLVEWLSFDNFGMLLLRIFCSTLLSLLLDYILIILFMKRLSA